MTEEAISLKCPGTDISPRHNTLTNGRTVPRIVDEQLHDYPTLGIKSTPRIIDETSPWTMCFLYIAKSLNRKFDGFTALIQGSM